MNKSASFSALFKWTDQSHEPPKVIDKSQADIDTAIAAIKAEEE